MNELQIFNYSENQVRTVLKDGQPYFVAKDVCDILEIGNVTMAIERLSPAMKGISTIETLGGNQEANVITEVGVYKLVFTSRKAEAERFTDWIASEVLPSIRKYGMYAKDELLDNPDLLLDVVTKYKEERDKNKQLENKIQVDKPKVIFADALETSKNSVLVGELAKLLARNGIEGIGQNRLFAWLRDCGYLHKNGEQYNLPTQKAIDLEIIETKTTTVNNPDGSVRVTKTPKINGKGQIYFVNKFKDFSTKEAI